MGIFSRILDKLRGHSAGGQAAGSQAGTQPPGAGQQTQAGTAAQQAGGAQLQNVNIDAVLSDLAKKKGGGGNYKESIVDLLKLLDLDSSLDARKELAGELGVNAGPHGSAEQNIALHKAVVKKIGENGGKVPDYMKN